MVGSYFFKTVLKLDSQVSHDEERIELVERYKRLVMNDLENIPRALIIIWSTAYILHLNFSSEAAWVPLLHGIAAVMFAIGRWVYYYGLANAYSITRGVAFDMGLLGEIVCLIIGIRYALKDNTLYKYTLLLIVLMFAKCLITTLL